MQPDNISAPDFMPIDQLRAMQLEKLQKITAYEYERVPLFRRRCDEKGVKPRDLATLADLAKFPFMKKTDLRDEYPLGLTAAPMSEINRFHCSSGTTGKPICIPQTANPSMQRQNCLKTAKKSHPERAAAKFSAVGWYRARNTPSAFTDRATL